MLLELFFTFMKIGMFTFGGGYAMISVVENACVEDKHWITHDDMMNITVIAESTPGPIAINCATFVGYKKRGLIGAAVATTGMILPSFLIIYLVARFLDSFLEISWIAHAFEGIKLAVGILIIDAGIKMLDSGVRLRSYAADRYFGTAHFFHRTAPYSGGGESRAVHDQPKYREGGLTMIYLELFAGFLKVGLFSFGGGYASIPLIRDVVMSYGWLSEDMLTYMIAVSESTPGPIMVNLATYVGITQGGMLGAFVATFAVVLPAFFIIIAIVAFLSRVIENPYVAAVMQGLKSCVTGIILATGVHMVIRNCIISETIAEGSAPGAGAGNILPVDMRAAVVTLILAGIYYGSRKLSRTAGKRKGLTPIQLIGISAVLGMIVYR